MEDHLDEKDIAFKPRQGKGKNGKKKYWPDSSANNIIYCLDQCEGNCAHGLMMWYERGYYNGNANNSSGLQLDFQKDHLGHEVIYMKRIQKFKIPIISASVGFHNIADLKIGQQHVPESTKTIYKVYARRALVLFYPFREKNSFNTMLITHFGQNLTMK